MGTTSETDLVWVEELKAAFARSLPGDYRLQTLQRFQQCIEEEILLSSDRKRLNLLFETLLNFYSHFCWKIKFSKPSEIMKNGFIKLLASLIKVGLTIKCEARLRTILTVLTDEEDSLYTALLLVTHLKKKSQESYGVLLGDILCSRPLCPSTPESYLKIILLLRRLKSLSSKTPRQLASPPIHTISWLQHHCPQALPKKPKPHILTNHLMQKKLSADVLKDLREVLLPFDNKPCCLSKEEMETEEGSESIEDAFVIDSGDPSSHQHLNHLETNVSKKKRKSSVREDKTNDNEHEKRTLPEEFGEKVSPKKSKKSKHLQETEESIEDDRNSLQNEIKISELPDCSTEETKSKKKRRKSKKGKDSTLQLLDQVNENSSFEEENRNEEPKISMETSKLNESEDINEKSLEKETSCQEEIIVSSRKRRILLDAENSSPNSSVTTEKDCNTLSSSKKRKLSKRKKLSTSKEELKNQSGNLSLLSDSVADDGNINKSIENYASSESYACNSSQELDLEEAIEKMDLPQGLKIKKNSLKLQLPSSAETSKIINEETPKNLVQLTEENLEKDNVIEKKLSKDKHGLKTPRKSKKSLCKNKDLKSQSDAVQKAEEKRDEIVNVESEKQLLETSSKVISDGSQAKNQLQDKDLINYLPNSLSVNDFKDQNMDGNMKSKSDANTSIVYKSINEINSSSTAAKYEEQSAVLQSSVGNCQKKNFHESPRKKELNSEKDKIIDSSESHDQIINKSSSVEAEIKENLPKSAEENANIHCNETDSSVITQSNIQIPSGFEEANESMCVDEDSTKETAQCELDEIYNPENLLQKLKEECKKESSEQRDNSHANVSVNFHLENSFKIEDESEEPESEIKGIEVTHEPSFERLDTYSHYSDDLKKEDPVKSEEQKFHPIIVVESRSRVENSARRVFPLHIKKSENSDEESELKSFQTKIKSTPDKEPIASVLASGSCSSLHDSNGFAFESSPKKEIVETLIDTNLENEVDNQNQAISICKSESKRAKITVHCSENLINKVSVKSQSSDSEMSVKEANINEYEEKLAENIESEKVQLPDEHKSKLLNSQYDVNSDSDESLKESLDLDRSVEELSECLISPNKPMSKSKPSMKKNENLQSTADSLCYDSGESISSLNLEEEENQVHKSQEPLGVDKNVEKGIISEKSNGQDILCTPRKSRRLTVGKQSLSINSTLDEAKSPQKLLRSSPNSIKIQDTSCANHLTVDDESNNSAVPSVDGDVTNLDSNAKSNIEKSTRSKKRLDSERVCKRTRNCCVVLDNILESADLTEILKEELSTTDEEPVQKVSQEDELNSTKKDPNLCSKSSPHKQNNWTLSYESDSPTDSSDERDIEKSKKMCVSHSRKKSKTAKPLSDLNFNKELTKPSEPEQEVGCRRYNLRNANKTFPNVKQPHSQKLAAVPSMSFSPLIRKARNYPKFSDVSHSEVPLPPIQAPIFNEIYRESPADVTINGIALKIEDETSSTEGESLSNPMEADNMSKPVESKESVGQVSSENNSDLESSQGTSENVNDKPTQHLQSENNSDLESSQGTSENVNDKPSKRLQSKSTSNHSPVKNSESKSLCPGPIIKISKSRLKTSSSSKKLPARGYSLRSRGATVDLDLNLEKLSIGTPLKKVNPKEKDTESSMPKETKVPESHTYLRRSKRNVVLPGKLKL